LVSNSGERQPHQGACAVWLYDLGSTRGTQVDGSAVAGRAYLDGVHRVSIGHLDIEVGAHAGLLV